MRRWLPLVLLLLVPGCGGDEPLRPPETLEPPAILSVAVAPDSILAGAVSVAVTAERADSVSLWVDGVAAAGDATAPFLFTWDSRAAHNGTHDLTVRAENAAGLADTTLSRLVLNPGRGAVVFISPADTLLEAGSITRFTAVVLGEEDTRVTWSAESADEIPVDGGPGSVDDDGLYTAPEFAPDGAAVLVRATSVADPSASAAARVTLERTIRLVIQATPRSVRLGQVYALQARVFGSAYDGVKWSILEGAGHGTVDEAGLYSAPRVVPEPPRVTFVVRGLYYPTLTDTLESIPIEQTALISFITVPSSVLTGQGYQIQAAVSQTTDERIRYGIDEGPDHGTIDENGFYTAPATRPVPSQVTFRATSLADTMVTVSRTVPITSSVGVSLVAPPAWVLTDRTAAFSATVSGTADTRVRWSVVGAPGHGTIDQDGVYTGPSARPDPPHATIRATSLADTLESASVTVPVYGPVSVRITPDSTAVIMGDQVRFAATVDNAPAGTISWSVSGGLSFGNITSSGLYTAPFQLPDPPYATVRAVSTIDPSAYDEAVVQISYLPQPPEVERLAEIYAGTYEVTELAEEVTGIVGTALGIARYLANDDQVHCGALIQNDSGWSFYPGEGDWLEIAPLDGPYVLIEFTTVEGTVPYQDGSFRFMRGVEFKGELDCTIQVGQRGTTLRLTNSSVSRWEMAKPACPCSEEAAYLRTLEGTIPGVEGGTWDLDVTLRGDMWNCYDSTPSTSSGVNQSLSGMFTTPAGFTVAVEDTFSTETGASGYHTTSLLRSFSGEFTATDALNTYVWSGLSFFWSWQYDAPRDAEDWRASGTVYKNGVPYGIVHFDRPIAADMTAPPHAVAEFGPDAAVVLDDYRFNFLFGAGPVPNPFVTDN